MSITERVYQALNASKELTAQLAKDKKGRCIYHGISPDAGSYPILVYSLVSDVPALTADGLEQERRVTVRIHILTKDGKSNGIYTALQKVMLSLGFLRYQTTELAEKGLFIRVIDYKTGIGAEE